MQRCEAIDLGAGRRCGSIRASGWPVPVAVGRVESDDPFAVTWKADWWRPDCAPLADLGRYHLKAERSLVWLPADMISLEGICAPPRADPDAPAGLTSLHRQAQSLTLAWGPRSAGELCGHTPRKQAVQFHRLSQSGHDGRFDHQQRSSAEANGGKAPSCSLSSATGTIRA